MPPWPASVRRHARLIVHAKTPGLAPKISSVPTRQWYVFAHQRGPEVYAPVTADGDTVGYFQDACPQDLWLALAQRPAHHACTGPIRCVKSLPVGSRK